MRVLAGLVLMLLFAGLFVRSYTLPPAPDRRGGTTIALAWPNRALFGSPRGDCVGGLEDEAVIACLIGSVSRFRAETIPLVQLPFCGTCYGLSPDPRLPRPGRESGPGQARPDGAFRLVRPHVQALSVWLKAEIDFAGAKAHIAVAASAAVTGSLERAA
ncbi:hypothetical protein [Methylobacterium sp.]|uniref:hypothetical protein n=1 Tax=Methylobacterium sp. TaxID=409 RepID=UPI003B026FD8